MIFTIANHSGLALARCVLLWAIVLLTVLDFVHAQQVSGEDGPVSVSVVARADDAIQKQEEGVTLYWANGDALAGELAGADAAHVTWKSPLIPKPHRMSHSCRR